MLTLYLRNPYLLWMSILILIIMGVSASLAIPRIEDPRITARFGTASSNLPGASAERVEALIVEPIERRLEKIKEIKTLQSVARQGRGEVRVELQDSVSAERAPAVFSIIRDELDAVRAELPEEASIPVLEGDRDGTGGYTVIAAVIWKAEPTHEMVGVMQRLADHLADELRRLPETDHVETFGDFRTELEVQVDLFEASAAGLSVDGIAQRLQQADSKVPSGIYRGQKHHFALEVEGEFLSTERIARIPLVTGERGAALFLDDVAHVEKGFFRPTPSYAAYDGNVAIMIAARASERVQTDRWVALARERVSRVAQLAGGPLSVELIYDQSSYTAARLWDLISNMVLGGLVVLLVILLVMGWKSAVIVGLSLPLTVSATLFILNAMGQQVHQISIFGMIVAIGLLIDNAIVIVDEVRHEIHHLGRSAHKAMSETLRKLMLPLLASTLTTVLAFTPIFLLPGSTGDFVGPIGMSVVFSLLTSFFISITIIAALVARYTKRQPPGEQAWYKEGIHAKQVRRLFRKVLLYFVGRAPITGVLISLIIPVAGFIAATQLPTIFFPSSDRDQFQIQLRVDSDTSTDQMEALLRSIDDVVRQNREVEHVSWVYGETHPPVYYNMLEGERQNSAYANAVVKMSSWEASNSYVTPLQRKLNVKFPQAQLIVREFGQGPPTEAPVGIRVLGPDYRRLAYYGEQIRQVMSQHPDVFHTRARMQSQRPRLRFIPDENKVRLAGLGLSDVASQLRGQLDGSLGGSLQEGLEQLDVRVRYQEPLRKERARLASARLLSPTAQSAWIPLDALGHFELTPQVERIFHYNGEPSNEAFAYIRPGAAAIDVANQVLDAFNEKVQLAAGYRVALSGDAEEQNTAMANLFLYVPLLIVLMATVLILSFGSLIQAGLIAIVAVLSLGMGLFALWLGGYPLGFLPILGSTGLIGVAINDSIVVLALIRENREARSGKPVAITETVINTTRHVLGTTFTTMGSFGPLLFLVGGQFWPPLAVVIAGGVGFATLLALLFTPCMYALIYRSGSQ